MAFDWGSFIGGLTGGAVGIVAIVVGARYAKRSADQAAVSANAALSSAHIAQESIDLDRQKHSETNEVELMVDLTLVLDKQAALMITPYNLKAPVTLEWLALILDKRFIMLEPQDHPFIKLPVTLERYSRYPIVIPADLLAAMLVEDVGLSGKVILKAFLTDSRNEVHLSGELEFNIDEYYTTPTLFIARTIKARDELMPMVSAPRPTQE